METTTAIMYSLFIVLLVSASNQTKNPLMTYALVARNVPYIEF